MITAQIASLPDRADSLRQTIDSLLPQVDSLFIALNNYNEVPSFCKHAKISTVLLDNSTGDAAKFYDVEKRHGYFFSCDDDLVYPPDYVEKMIKGILRYECIVTLHGRSFYNLPVLNYYSSATVKLRCLGDVDRDQMVHVGGTGVMAFDTERFKLRYSDFMAPNMADVWLARVAAGQGVPIMVLEHKEGYLRYNHPERNIYGGYHSNCTLQTEVVNSFL